MIDPISIHFSDNKQSAIYLVHSTPLNCLTYGVIHRHRSLGHICAYLNVDKRAWYRVEDTLRPLFNISYEGIGSSIFDLPSRLNNTLPVVDKGYWIGIDYMHFVEQPSQNLVLATLSHLANAKEWGLTNAQDPSL